MSNTNQSGHIEIPSTRDRQVLPIDRSGHLAMKNNYKHMKFLLPILFTQFAQIFRCKTEIGSDHVLWDPLHKVGE